MTFEELNIDVAEVENLLVQCILDKLVQNPLQFKRETRSYEHFSTVRGKIDQVKGILELDRGTEGHSRYRALDKWAVQLSSLHQTITNKMA